TSHSDSIREIPFTVGVDVRIVLRFQNVVDRLRASETGSPSVPALGGYLSTSSASTILIGRDARDAGLLAPASVICPPGNVLCSSVLPLSLARGSFTLP